MKTNNVDVRLVIKGRVATEYPHAGDVYIEGRAGSQFEIEITNYNCFQVEAVVSVDGLSVIDGKEASEQSTGYLLKASETIRIPGWKLNDKAVAAFVFSKKENAYSTQMTGSANNTGVIGVMVFREKPAIVPTTVFPATQHPNQPWSTPYQYGGNLLRGGILSASCAVGSAQNSIEQNIGTGFGQETNFATKTVQFSRGSHLTTAILYYDNIRGLKARGVPIERVNKKTYQSRPQAFPGSGCTPPSGWKNNG